MTFQWVCSANQIEGYILPKQHHNNVDLSAAAFRFYAVIYFDFLLTGFWNKNVQNNDCHHL